MSECSYPFKRIVFGDSWHILCNEVIVTVHSSDKQEFTTERKTVSFSIPTENTSLMGEEFKKD